jgi:hypothetical protein
VKHEIFTIEPNTDPKYHLKDPYILEFTVFSFWHFQREFLNAKMRERKNAKNREKE